MSLKNVFSRWQKTEKVLTSQGNIIEALIFRYVDIKAQKNRCYASEEPSTRKRYG